MDPISAAIVAALAAGVAGGATEVGKKVIVDAYDALKAAIARKCGVESDLVKAVNELEKKPDSKGRQATLQEEVATGKVEQDEEIVKVARELMAKLNELPAGQQAIQNIQNVTGDKNIFSNTGDVHVGDVNF